MSAVEYADTVEAARALLIRDLAALTMTREVLVASPAAGTEFSTTPPAGVYWDVLAVTARLVADATVANRTPSLIFDDGTATGLPVRLPMNVAQTASTTLLYTWAQGLSSIGAVGGMAQNGLPMRAAISQGWRVRSTTVNLQVTDAWSQIVFLVREWSVVNLVWASRYVAQTLAEQSSV